MDGFPLQLWEAAKLAGPFGTILMLFVWWRTDTERRTLLGERQALLERMIGAMTTATEAIRELTRALYVTKRDA